MGDEQNLSIFSEARARLRQQFARHVRAALDDACSGRRTAADVADYLLWLTDLYAVHAEALVGAGDV